MKRDEYLVRAREMAPRGASLPQTRLDADAVRAIREAADERAAVRARLSQTVSNAALAARFGVSVRAIERVLAYETHVGVDDE